MKRWPATVFSVLLLAVVLAPSLQNFRDEPRDDFPLSYYPMFSRRHDDVQSHTSLIGVEADGTRHVVHYRHAGSGGMNQVRKQIRRAARDSRASALKLCERVAKRVEKRDDPELADVTEIRVVTGKYHVLDYFLHGRTEPLDEEIHACCGVPRGGTPGSSTSTAEVD